MTIPNQDLRTKSRSRNQIGGSEHDTIASDVAPALAPEPRRSPRPAGAGTGIHRVISIDPELSSLEAWGLVRAPHRAMARLALHAGRRADRAPQGGARATQSRRISPAAPSPIVPHRVHVEAHAR